MSIPGLGQLKTAAAPTTSSAATVTTTQVSLQPFWEWRFEVAPSSSLTLRLLSGTAEKDGMELAPKTRYTFSATKTKINTWHGCELEVSSASSSSYDAYVAQPSAAETPMVSYLNLHMKLEDLRAAAAISHDKVSVMGPRVLITGPANSGKTCLVKTLVGWATRMGRQPLVVNTDSVQGMLSLPGTLSAGVFSSIMDVTSDWGVGSTPSSGPAAIPVKLPLAYFYGLASQDRNANLFKALLSRMALATTSRLAEDPEVHATGMLIDTAALSTSTTAAQKSHDILAHIVAEFSVNIIIVLGAERLTAEMVKRFSGQKTSLGEDITIVGLEKSGGVVERDDKFMQSTREAALREYFFGDGASASKPGGRNLSPSTQTLEFGAVVIWKVVTAATTEDDDEAAYNAASIGDAFLEKVEPSPLMLYSTLAVTYANLHDSASVIKDANIMGYVYVSEVDEKKKRIKVLAPVSARLGEHPLLWGSWPEGIVSLLD